MATLNLLVYGPPKVGKTRLGATTPTPRVIFDAGGETKFLPGKKVSWRPDSEEPPKAGDWDTCVVRVNKWDTFDRALQWLSSGKHPFRSATIDHLTESQKLLIRDIRGVDQLADYDWGTVLRKMEDMVRRFKDLSDVSIYEENALDAVVIIAAGKAYDGVRMPFLQGQFRDNIGYMLDVLGYMYADRMEDGSYIRRLLIHPHAQFIAGDRTDVLTRTYGHTIEEPHVGKMLEAIERELATNQ